MIINQFSTQRVKTTLDLSIVIPIYNEEESIPNLFKELHQELISLPTKSYELLLVDDGSLDNSRELLQQMMKNYPQLPTVLVFLDGNFGQHQAIMAGFSVARGSKMITLDADLQNPPSQIKLIYQKMLEGHDYVGSIRENRQDAYWRKIFSKLNNLIREKITNIKLTDQGCMLRGYDWRVVQLMLAGQESALYLPALGYSFARKPVEIYVVHQNRELGVSKYSFLRLLRLNFDIMTVYSLVPIQTFSFLGIVIAGLSGAFFVLLVVRRLLIGPEAEGLFTLFALLFFFIGICLFGLGILGEYIGRIYAEVRRRPRFLIQEVWRDDHEPT